MNLWLALALLVVFASMAWKLGAVTWSGAVAGTVLGTVVASTVTPAPFWTFVMFVVIGSVSSKIGKRKKRTMGVLQENEGARDWRNAVFNCAPAASIAVLHQLIDFPGSAVVDVVVAGALAAMLADTCASEWGTLFGGAPRDIFTLRRVAVGTDGAVSIAGTLAGTAAGALAAVPAWICLDQRAALAVFCAGALGNVLDSMLGSVVQPHLGKEGNAIVNFLASFGGAAIAYLLIR